MIPNLLEIKILNAFKCLETCNIASQCPNKEGMILKSDVDIKIEGESNDEYATFGGCKLCLISS